MAMSKIAIAAADSTMGAARSTMQGSCRPDSSKIFGELFLASIVICFFAIEGVGLKATLKIIGIPELIPPKIPP